MVPQTYPSNFASNGQSQMRVSFLTNVVGLKRWTDYIPVKLSTGGVENSYDNNGYINVSSVTLTPKSMPFNDYVPVYVDTSAADAWQVNDVGYIPYGYAMAGDASLMLDFTNGAALDSRVTFTRASDATVTGPDGFIQSAPNNLLTYSEQFDNAAWTKSNSTVTTNSMAAPDGSLTADKLVEDTALSGHLTLQSITLSDSTTYTVSVFVKSAERTWVAVGLTDKAGVNNRVWFNTVTGAQGTTNGTVSLASATNFGNGWRRFSVSVSSATGATTPSMRISIGSADNTASYTGNGTSGIYIWGAQLNIGALQPYYTTTMKNQLGFTQEFDNAAWSKSGASVTANAIVAPDASLTADKLIEDTSTGPHYTTPSGTSLAVIGQVLTYSVYAKAAGRDFLQLIVTAIGPAGANLIAGFNLVTGVAGTPSPDSIATIVNAGNGWYRCSIEFTVQAAATPTRQIRISQNSNASPSSYTGDGTSGLYLWGAQFSDSASLDPYVYNPGAAPTSTAYYGPRFDYDPVTLAPKGLLIEEQRTNLALNSEVITASIGTTVSPDAINAPNNTLTADLITDTGTTGEHYAADRPIAVTAGTTYTWSVFVKDGLSANRSLYLRVATAANITLVFNPRTKTISNPSGTGYLSSEFQELSNGWFRVSMTFTAQTTATLICRLQLWETTTIYTGVLGSGLYLWGAQLEAGSFATSYIPTVDSQVTRAADVVTMVGDNFSSWYNPTEGSFYSEFLAGSSPTSTRVISANSGISSNSLAILGSNSSGSTGPYAQVTALGVTQSTLAIGAPVANALESIAFGYKLNDFAAARNGVLSNLDNLGTIPTGIFQLNIGSDGSAYLNGHIQQTIYFPRRLSNTELQGITA